ncbi:MAG: putative quinol monooxygenase [Rhodobacterales bacterium]|uniref:putative quinol monooxygenase n=1 Tax=Puniceibacterium antarcticum TaxID=1206336 RepID=UPI001C558620|nr:putative quinol monooxygenase [Puniceibacterium antarcticum]
MIHLTGTLRCAPDQQQNVRDALPDHIALTRAEPGCLEFEVVETAPGLFAVSELFSDQAAFDAHQTRTRASAWFAVSEGMVREYKITTV